MRKMVLVPIEHVDELKRLRQHHAKLPPKPEIIQTVEMQNKMNEVMSNPSLTINEKNKLY